MKEVHLTHLFLVIGGQNYKKTWKYSVYVVRFMTRKIKLVWKISDVYSGEDEIEASWDLHMLSAPPPTPLLLKEKHNWLRF